MRYKELADAIRRGAKMRPRQASNLLFDGFGTCAIGGAAEARGWVPTIVDIDLKQWVAKFVPELTGGSVLDKESLFYKISFRNDSGWSREQIADWLDSLEEPGESDSDWAKRKVAEVTRVKEAA